MPASNMTVADRILNKQIWCQRCRKNHPASEATVIKTHNGTHNTPVCNRCNGRRLKLIRQKRIKKNATLSNNTSSNAGTSGST